MWTWLKKWCQDDKPANEIRRADCLQRPQAPPPVQERAQRGCKHPTRLPERIVNAINGFVKGRRPSPNRAEEMEDAADETKNACMATVLSIFPEICTEFLQETAQRFQYNSEQTIDEILRLLETGTSYPKRSFSNALKRKREASEDSDEEANIRRTYNHPNREIESTPEYLSIAKTVLKHEFPSVTVSGISKILTSKKNQLLPAYVAIETAISELQKGSRENIPEGFSSTKKARPKTENKYSHMELDRTIEITNNLDEKRALRELQAARKLREKRQKAFLDGAKEKLNFERALEDGNVVECGCCFDEIARNRAVCCQNLENPHLTSLELFCVGCARQTAEYAVGQSKYELACMSLDQCNAGFSREQRRKFLTHKLSAALDRIENEAILRMAGLENLERCPFCPYAAEYPPIATNREFQCDNPDCQRVSCRLCKEDTHLPKTCEEAEAARDKGIGARHEIEEAMSAALIRKCNKLPIGGTPFIKENGCNKMTCTAANCRNIQCYVCSKSCDNYTHFNDVTRGGKSGNCPLFDDNGDVSVRHKEEVKAAEDKARQKVLESNRDMDKDLLNFDMPEHNSRGPKSPSRNQRQAELLPVQVQPIIQAAQCQASRQRMAARPVIEQNALGQQVPQGNIARPQPYPFGEPWNNNPHLWRALPQQNPVPGQVANQAGFPARPSAEDPPRAYGGYRPHPGISSGPRFPAPQYQPQPQQPQQPQHPQRLPSTSIWPRQPVAMPRDLDVRHLSNIQFFNQPNPSQFRPMRPAAPVGPINGAQPQPAPAPRELKRQKHCARRPKGPPALQQADVQPVRMPEPRQAEEQGRQMNGGQLSPRSEAQPPTAPSTNPNNQAAKQSRNLGDHQHGQLAPVGQQTWQRHEALGARLQAQQQAPENQQVWQTPYQPAIVQTPGGHDMSAQWRRSLTVSNCIEPPRAIQGALVKEEKGAADVQEGANHRMLPIEQAAHPVSGLNPNHPRQPPAPDRPNWLMPASPRLLDRLAPIRQIGADTRAEGSSDEPLELD
ncbi:putative RING finger protein [Colletotrichum sublineola]|uniref:Putative RING finger protein n=1 Tax=Colletotrichum sublineola TaxID=1173701 RepID=A0A066XMN7_COLSU|nr:putative RING finger protein [Colletotrichum sublineola]